ncbi:MAG: hypothetical protein NTZ49_03670 [Candidatus Parcubacteria bacterium]|nr:hypothetical protein [Candidatus Parcubacteria bacterium]
MGETVQLCADAIDSYTDPEDPKALSRTCEKFFLELKDQADLLLEEQSYGVMTLLGKIRLINKTQAILLFEKGYLPSWEDITVAASRQQLVNDLRTKNDTVARQIIMIAFCLSCGSDIRCAGKTILRTSGVPSNTETPVKEVGEENEGEEDGSEETD